jgi:hypothetical protein
MGWQDYLEWAVAPGIKAGQAGLDAAGGTDALGQWLSGGGQPGLNQQNLPYFEEDRGRLGGMLGGQSPWVNTQFNNPYGQDFRSLIGQLQTAAGPGGDQFNSTAIQQYRAANARNMQNQLALARSGPAGMNPALASRQAAMGMGRTQQGLAAGVAQARTAERQGAQQALGNVLNGAANADVNYQGIGAQQSRANQSAFLDLLGKQLGLSEAQMRGQLGTPLGQGGPANWERLLQMLSQMGGMAASL